jgi:hypothetical protein
MAVQTYVVSVYRRSNEPGKEAAGLIEHAGDGERKAFASSQELWAFLCHKSGDSEAKESRKRPARARPGAKP